MFDSIGFGEILIIAIVALIVFGPHRLPEIARKAGELLAKARRATQDLADALDAEYEADGSPLKDLRSEYEQTKQQLTDTIGKVGDLAMNGNPSATQGAGTRDAPADAQTIGEHPSPYAAEDAAEDDGGAREHP